VAARLHAASSYLCARAPRLTPHADAWLSSIDIVHRGIVAHSRARIKHRARFAVAQTSVKLSYRQCARHLAASNSPRKTRAACACTRHRAGSRGRGAALARTLAAIIDINDIDIDRYR